MQNFTFLKKKVIDYLLLKKYLKYILQLKKNKGIFHIFANGYPKDEEEGTVMVLS